MTPAARMMERARNIARTLTLPTAAAVTPADPWSANARRFRNRAAIGDAVAMRTSRRAGTLFEGYTKPAQVIPQAAALAEVDTGAGNGLLQIKYPQVPSRTVPAPIP